ncbi:hypothetical protein JZ751_016581 [Albula glossodonta]|uniref:Uncharacterized protein n=1 Tax=Albula glossodonta TaxID=121402 RepID=A0A8T2MU78_9TELE|nr:hypothetical protein JZ751_016581 [Albula glossodonta]
MAERSIPLQTGPCSNGTAPPTAPPAAPPKAPPKALLTAPPTAPPKALPTLQLPLLTLSTELCNAYCGCGTGTLHLGRPGERVSHAGRSSPMMTLAGRRSFPHPRELNVLALQRVHALQICSILQCVPAITEICSILQCVPAVTEICSVLQCVPAVTEICSVLQCVPAVTEITARTQAPEKPLSVHAVDLLPPPVIYLLLSLNGPMRMPLTLLQICPV